MRARTRPKVHVKVELHASRRPRHWRITRLAVGKGDTTDAADCYQECPKRKFRTSEAALEDARRRAWTAIHKTFGPVATEDVIWEITPPDDCSQKEPLA